MTDPDLVAKKLAFIETCVAEIRRLGQPDRIESDVREERFVERTLQIAIQAALDVGSHVVSDVRLGEPTAYRDVFELLIANDWLPSTLDAPLRNMVGLRNILVHGYEVVNAAILRQIVDDHLVSLPSASGRFGPCSRASPQRSSWHQQRLTKPLRCGDPHLSPDRRFTATISRSREPTSSFRTSDQ